MFKKISLESELPSSIDTLDYGSRDIKLSNFGEMCLQKMGVGNTKQQSKSKAVKTIQFIPRPPGLGLGSVSKEQIIQKIKAGKKIDNNDLVNKKSKNYTVLGEGDHSEEEDDGVLKYGQKVRICKGKYKGMEAIMKDIQDDEKTAKIELFINKEDVNLPLRYLKKIKKKKKINKKVKAIKRAKNSSKKGAGSKSFKWLTTGLHLRIVSKKYKEGKYFMKKGVVEDILGPNSFIFVTDENEILEDLKEKYMETLIPKKGKSVKILTGSHKGKVGILYDKVDKKSIKVQLDQDKVILLLGRSEVCGFVR